MSETKNIYKVTINAPIETVWSTLVKTDELLPFFFGSFCRTPDKLEVGAPFAMQSKNGKFSGVVGKVLEFHPPYRYSHTFKMTSFDDPPCTVTYELKETADGTEFSLITTNVPSGTKTEQQMKQGGNFIVNVLKSVVETGHPSFGYRILLGIMGLAAPFTPKQCRTKNWPFDKIEKL